MSGVKLITGGRRVGRAMRFIEGFETEKQQRCPPGEKPQRGHSENQKSPLLHALLENVAKAIIPQTEEKMKTK